MSAHRVIVCDRCQKPVERIEDWIAWQDTPRETLFVRVWCHGETQQESAPTRAVIVFGRAFIQPKALPA